MPNDLQTIKLDTVGRLWNDLRAGHSDAFVSYLLAMARLHRQTWDNVTLIYAQRPTATLVASETVWREHDRSVKTGEQGIRIEAAREGPSAHRLEPHLERPARRDWPDAGSPREAVVFDMSQTDGKPLPLDRGPLRTSQLKGYIRDARQSILAKASTVIIDGAQPRELVISSYGQFTLPLGLAPHEEFPALVRQWAHQVLHYQPGRFSLPIAVIDAEAEAARWVVCRAIGLECVTPSAGLAVHRAVSAFTDSLKAIHAFSRAVLTELHVHGSQRVVEGDRVRPSSARADTRTPIHREPLAPPDPSDTLPNR